ncbi:MAG TPA: MerR family transcriptional regulator [Kineosporiaceae bacterium]|nr:MerR family transcriptional regulator [Kineosporiaceae bacterium]
MTDDDLLTISAFARLVGLTASALRFYADCDLLPPAQIHAGSGYRLYSLDQQPRAALLRRLREVDLPLAEVRVVLDGPAEDVARILRAHLGRLEGKLEPARRATAMILESLSLPADACQATLAGPELASAVRQVASAAATTPAIPALACVFLELGDGEVSLVATDRYRLSVRVLTARRCQGRAHLLVPVAALTELTGWAIRHDEVRLMVDDGVVTLSAGTEHRQLPTLEADFPDYRAILHGLEPSTTRAIVDRARLLELLVNGDLPTMITLTIGQDRVVVAGNDSQETVFDAVCTGSPMRLGFGTAVLAAALAAGVGPEALLELTAPDRVVLIRSADQGTFTTLAMPTRLQPE